MIKKSFTLAFIIYIFNSVANVLQGVLIKYNQASLSMDLYETIFLKSLVSAIIMLPFSFKYLKKIKNLHIVLLLSLLYSGDLLLCNTGFKTVPINTGTLILLLIPLWIVVFSRIILKEKSFNIVNAIALLVCLFAVYLTIKDEISFTDFNTGYLYLFAASMVIPLGLILQKKFTDTRPVVYALFTNSVVLGTISLFIYTTNSNLSATNIFNNLTQQKLIACLFVAICDLIEFSSVYVAYQITEPALLQPVRFTRILFSIVLSYLFLLETPNKYQIISAILIIFSNMFSFVYSRRKQNK